MVVCMCVCVSDQGQYMTLSSRALTRDRGIRRERQSGPGQKV